MSANSLVKPFIFSLVILPVVFVVTFNLKGAQAGGAVTMTLFAATVLVELFALAQFVRVRRRFAAGDAGHLTWTLLVTFMMVRLLGEGRLLTLTYGVVPEYNVGSSTGLFVYVAVLRYLYTLSDVLFIAALLTTIRSYKSTGLPFRVLPVDYLYMMAVWTLPVVTYILRDNLLQTTLGTADGYVRTFRLVAVTVGAAIVSVCIVVRRYAAQMGGGAVARVWNMVVISGVARDGSFLALALLAGWSKPTASFVEQYLLWTFSCCWLIAALYQSAVFSRAVGTEPVAVAQSVAG
jgi:hypothetical protein